MPVRPPGLYTSLSTTDRHFPEAVAYHQDENVLVGLQDDVKLRNVKGFGEGKSWIWPFPESRLANNTYIVNAYSNFNIQNANVYTTNVNIEPERVQLRRCQPPSGLFVGRDTIILGLEQYFFNDQPVRHVYVLHGIGGAGKSQISFRFIDKVFYSQEPAMRRFSQVYYVDASNLTTIEASLKHIAAAEGISADDSSHTIRWLSHHKSNWLLFFDNADDTKINLRDYFPPCTHGNILITSRAHASHLYGEGPESHFSVPVLEVTESAVLLQRAACLNTDTAFPQEDAVTLVEKLGRLPLAIVQAGSYMAEMTCTITEYLAILNNTPEHPLRSYKQTSAESNWPVYATWDLNYQQLVEKYPISARLLEVLSFMHHQGIFIEMFKTAFENIWKLISSSQIENIGEEEQQALGGARHLLGAFQNAASEDHTWSPQPFFEAMSKIRDFSLLDRDSATQAYSMHPLVHEWAKTVSPPGTKQRCILFLAAAVSFDFDTAGYALRDALLPHINKVWQSGQSVHSAVAASFQLVYYQGGQWEKAEELEKHVLKVRTTKFGPDSLETLGSVHNLASIYDQQGRYTEAISLLTRVVDLQKSGYGAEDDRTLSSTTLLASLYRKVGQWTTANDLLKTTYDAFVEHHGEEVAMKNSTILTILANLARIRQVQGRWKEAAQLGLKTYEARKLVLGEDHPDTFISANDYALALNGLHLFSAARSLLITVEEYSKKRLGKDHPDTLVTTSNIALTYKIEGREPEKVESIQSEVLVARRRVLGDDHPETLKTKGMLAWAYKMLGKLEEAAVLAVEIAETRAKPEVLGPEHPDTMTAIHNLADIYVSQGPAGYTKAEELFKRVIEVEQRTLSDDHPDKYTTMNSLACLYYRQRRLEDAKEMFETILEYRRAILGNLHSDTLQTMSWLAGVYRKVDLADRAHQLDLEVQEAGEKNVI